MKNSLSFTLHLPPPQRAASGQIEVTQNKSLSSPGALVFDYSPGSAPSDDSFRRLSELAEQFVGDAKG